jgi:cytochrome c oxidase subunit 2
MTDKTGVYRGQCVELCGRDHGFMPIVVNVVTKDEFKAWLAEQKAAAPDTAPAAADAAPTAATRLAPARRTHSSSPSQTFRPRAIEPWPNTAHRP